VAIEYHQGQRITPYLHEMTPLEAAIRGYEQQAKNYYQSKKSPVPASPEERLKKEQELASTLQHLNNERIRLSSLAQVEAGLELYRAAGREQADQDPFEMLNEKHHPTKVLAKHMRADGRPQPSERHSPHHLVQGKGRHPRTADVRLRLHLYGIRINDPDNGAWMPRTKADKGHWSMPYSPAHSEIHTFNYETWANFLLLHLDSEQTIRSALVRIRSLLRDGKQPEQVTQQKDPNWRPVA